MIPLDLPIRVAQVTHALMEAWSERHGNAPVKAAEVCIYDAWALTPRHTAAALAQARQHGLADGRGGLWFATDRAWEIRRALETLVLGDS